MASPRMLERRVLSDRANRFGRYLSLLAASNTLRRVGSDTLAPSGKVRETADRDTPAIRATSSEVAGCRRGRRLTLRMEFLSIASLPRFQMKANPRGAPLTRGIAFADAADQEKPF